HSIFSLDGHPTQKDTVVNESGPLSIDNTVHREIAAGGRGNGASARSRPKLEGARAVREREVPAVRRAVAILRLLGKSETALGVNAIARALGLVPSTCLHILRV